MMDCDGAGKVALCLTIEIDMVQLLYLLVQAYDEFLHFSRPVAMLQRPALTLLPHSSPNQGGLGPFSRSKASPCTSLPTGVNRAILGTSVGW